jgi:predicted transcriptional regulator
MILVETCNRLGKLNKEQTKIMKELLLKNSKLTKLCASIYSILSTKINRIGLVENWLKSLREYLKKKA